MEELHAPRARPLHLRRQLVYTGEFSFTQECLETHGNALAIKIRLLIKNMRLAQNTTILDCWPHADIGDAVADETPRLSRLRL